MPQPPNPQIVKKVKKLSGIAEEYVRERTSLSPV